MGREPPAAGPHQLVDLIGAHPVVLGVIEHRQKHVEVVECLGQPQFTGQPHVDVGRLAPGGNRGVERGCAGRDPPAERLEEAAHEVGTAPARHGGHVQVQRDRPRGKLRPRIAAARHCRAEYRGQCHREHARCGIGPVVDKLPEREALSGRALAAAHERHGVDLDQQSRRATGGRGLRVEDVRDAGRHAEFLHPARVLVQQETKVGRRFFGGGDREQHDQSLCPTERPRGERFPPRGAVGVNAGRVAR